MRSLVSAHSGKASRSESIEGMAQIFTQVGTFRGVTVAIRKVMKNEIILTRENLLEMKIVSHIRFPVLILVFLYRRKKDNGHSCRTDLT